MPIYEYRCTSCDRRFETMQRLSDPPLTECETCGGALQKLISAPAFQFKGSGWYVTDYAKSGKKESDSADGGKDAEKGGETKKADGDKKADAKTDAAPAKTETKKAADPAP